MLNPPFRESPTQEMTPTFTKGFPVNSLWILLFAKYTFFLNPDPEKVFHTIPRTCVSLSQREALLRQLFNSGMGRTSPSRCPHGPNQLPFKLVKNLLGIAEIRF